MTEAQDFRRSVQLPVSATEAFAWHERPGALQRLIPPWENVEVKSCSGPLADGAVVELVNRLGPFRLRWIARHHDFLPGEQFCDSQQSGPFHKWNHQHLFHRGENHSSVLEDHIEYEIPGGWLGQAIGGSWIRGKIERMFDYRHRTTRADLEMHAKFGEKNTMHVAVTGSSGLVGAELIPFLTTGGHRVTRITRSAGSSDDVVWDPGAGKFNAEALDGVDAVVHLAGENIAAGRWTAAKKARIRDSRVNGTRLLCEGLAGMKTPPKVLVAASAIGFYGDRGDEILTEESSSGDGFLADVCRQWEAATAPAEEAGVRVAHMRFGVILSPRGGALAKMLTPFKLGGGGIVGSGRQYWSWVSLDDVAGAIHQALMTDSLAGPVNCVSPHPATNLQFTKELGRVLHRPTILPMPAFAARLALGEMADELLLSSARVEPRRLLDSGYNFRQPSLEGALRHLLGKTS